MNEMCSVGEGPIGPGDLTYPVKQIVAAVNLGRMDGRLGIAPSPGSGTGIYRENPDGNVVLVYNFHFVSPQKGTGGRYRVRYHASLPIPKGEDVVLTMYITEDNRVVLEFLHTGILLESLEEIGDHAEFLGPPTLSQ